MPLALVALMISAFGIGTTEFVINGLLPDLSAEFGVSIPTAGLLVSGYAFGVFVGAPVLTILGNRLSRKKMLLLLMVVFIAGNLLSALATSYGALMAGRIVSSFAHGAFFGVGSVVAANLVAPQKRAQAIAMMFTGLTVANVVGVPVGTLLGQNLGWQSAFWAVVAIGVVGLIGVAALVPADRPDAERPALRTEFRVFRRPQVWMALGMTVLGFAPAFTVLTFIAPMATEVAGFSESAVPILVGLFGVGVVAGNLVGARLADRALMPSLYAILVALIVISVAFLFAAHSQVAFVIAILAFGVAAFATVPPLQTRVLDKAEGAPTLASAVNIGAFNLGNAIGPFLGGVVIDAGLGYTATAWVAALLGVAGLALALVSGAMDRRSARLPEPALV
ncbi:MFS transporter [Phytomonospora endophytica]|uniref:DHA1 family inner membrane transport protein n=1 Tax=Phytomonospora endophytica TaxID=714109 RepID=A0A841FCM7_9ACTN|nr:MFS transporter [Phytomonospora endophytica]MBB6033544.1 DHA1 family inner membrane transport protein [Phytomonospora endophytica]GIG64938.1 MFS transporter [Phytomonospora endophytica]